ncbi:NgoBV family restriction endonuclease [Vallitalea guaymasensis]|mgnify:CR=1 FL=1|uniref:NgoBV family restriction endonuclease n=1 Tax=Vallitalea guaymasensis TaxID=1185412 RepID=UPI002354D0B6|nr:NgoBV family restriction endonuclease [Vallitalea guaymasensis]
MTQLRKVSSEELYQLLIKSKTINNPGKIIFNMADVNVIINTTDTVGITLQSWLKQWMLNNHIYFKEPNNTQEFPDFYLNDNDLNNSLLEIKAFNYNISPAFDIANFESYCSSLMNNAYRLNANYLIFGYIMERGVIKIKKIWLKKIWEISSGMKSYALRVQAKRGMIYNIRPTKWYSERSTPPFANKEAFIKAIYYTLKQYEHTSIDEESWLDNVLKNYKLHTSTELKIDL